MKNDLVQKVLEELKTDFSTRASPFKIQIHYILLNCQANWKLVTPQNVMNSANCNTNTKCNIKSRRKKYTKSVEQNSCCGNQGIKTL